MNLVRNWNWFEGLKKLLLLWLPWVNTGFSVRAKYQQDFLRVWTAPFLTYFGDIFLASLSLITPWLSAWGQQRAGLWCYRAASGFRSAPHCRASDTVLAHIPAPSPCLSHDLHFSFFPGLGILFHFFHIQCCLSYNDTTLVPWSWTTLFLFLTTG